jgi:hypothetical protein
MISKELYEKFFSTYHPSYDGKVMKTMNWCFEPRIQDNGYTEFINRKARPCIDISFDAKYNEEERCIDIRIYYEYEDLMYEKGRINFKINDYKNNTYKCLTYDDKKVNFLADQEIITFLKQFDEYVLELQDINPIKYDDYVKYMIHIYNKCPELLKPHNSKICNYSVSLYPAAGGIVVKFDYYYIPNKYSQYKEFLLFRNRAVGDDFNDIDIELYDELITRYDMIFCDFLEYFTFG